MASEPPVVAEMTLADARGSRAVTAGVAGAAAVDTAKTQTTMARREK